MSIQNLLAIRRKKSELRDNWQVIEDRAEDEGRALTGDEEGEYKKVKRQLDKLDSQEADILRDTELAQDWRQMINDTPVALMEQPGGGHDSPQGEIRFVRHGESFTRAVTQEPLPDGIRAEELSVGRTIKGLATGKWRGAEAEKRAMQGQENPAGGYFLPGPLSSRLIDLSRANQVTSQAGAVVIPVEADSLRVPKVLADPDVQWRGELEAITESDPTFGSVLLVPKVCAVLIKISQELYEDGVGVGDAVESVLAQALAVEKDRVCLMGGGAGNTNEPTGIYYTDGVTQLEVGVDGDPLVNYNPFINAIEAVENANANPGSVIMNPRTKADLATIVTGIASDLTKLEPPEDYKALRKLITTSIPNDLTWNGSGADTTAAFVGGFSAVWVGLRNQVRIDVSPHGTGVFNQMGLWIRAFIRMDVAVVRPAELAVITGIESTR